MPCTSPLVSFFAWSVSPSHVVAGLSMPAAASRSLLYAMTNGRLRNGMPTSFFSSGPEMPSVAGTNRSRPPTFAQSASVSFTNAPVEYAVGVKVVPRS